MSDNRIIECMERAQYLLGNLMAVKPGEEVLIVVDPQTDERMTQAMAAAALNCGAEYGVYMMPIRGKDKATIFPKSLELGMDGIMIGIMFISCFGPIRNRNSANLSMRIKAQAAD